jgi:hypothetical protein
VPHAHRARVVCLCEQRGEAHPQRLGYPVEVHDADVAQATAGRPVIMPLCAATLNCTVRHRHGQEGKNSLTRLSYPTPVAQPTSLDSVPGPRRPYPPPVHSPPPSGMINEVHATCPRGHFLRLSRFLRSNLGVKTSDWGRWQDKTKDTHARSQSSSRLPSFAPFNRIQEILDNPLITTGREISVSQGIL